MAYKVAVVGATGVVGREMLNILHERQFPVSEVVPLASRRSVGKEVSFGDRTLKVKALEDYDFTGVDIALFSAGSAVSKEWAPRVAAKGAVAIDNSSCWRYHEDVPLIVPECNADAIGKFSKQIAFNVIPHIDVFMEDGFTKEEWKMVAETKKILDPKIKVVATCVRVPVFVGHSEAVHVEFENPISAAEARELLRQAPGVMVVDKREPGGYITPIECVGEYATFVSRIREDITVENGLAMWVVSDNLRKGAALNAVQIAEILGARYLKKAA